MTIRSKMLTLSTVFGLAMVAPATAKAEPASAQPAVTEDVVRAPDLTKSSHLRNLESELGGTGQVAEPSLAGPGTGNLVSASIAERPEAKVRSAPLAPPRKMVAWTPSRSNPWLDAQYGVAFAASVEECRIDVARRVGVTPAEIAAGTVTLRWTIEPTGKVRDVSAVNWSATDGLVTACAKRVVAGWPLINPVEKPLALEWTHAFRKLSASTEKVAASSEKKALAREGKHNEQQ